MCENSSGEELRKLGKESEFALVRGWVAQNPKTDRKTLQYMARNDKSKYVRQVAQNTLNVRELIKRPGFNLRTLKRTA